MFSRAPEVLFRQPEVCGAWLMCFCEYSWLFSQRYSPLSVCVCLGALWTPSRVGIPSQPKGTDVPVLPDELVTFYGGPVGRRRATRVSQRRWRRGDVWFLRASVKCTYIHLLNCAQCRPNKHAIIP